MSRPLAIAHRGDWRAHPENTLDAFRAAERAGADMVEIDVRRGADGAAWVLHDRTLERVWGLPRAIAELGRDELLAVGGIPHLADVLAEIETPLMVDYVDTDVAVPALEEVREAGALDRVVFAGGNLEGHRLLRRLEPDARIALTWTTRTPPSEALLDDLRPEYFNPPWELVEPSLVEAMHARGLAVSTWTVDDPGTMAGLVDLGVDAVITNRIADLTALLAREAAC